MLLKKEELKHLWPFYLCNLVEGLSAMIVPFFVIYFLHIGYSYLQISIIVSGSAFAQLLFEIPTGTFADGYSRKYSIILGCFIIFFSSILIPFTTNFFLVFLCFMLMGIGETFISGADEALIINRLNTVNRKDLHHEYFIKSKSFMALGAVFAPIFAALLIKLYSLKILWILYGVGYFIVSIIFLFFVDEIFIKRKINSMAFIKKSYHSSKMSFVLLIRNKAIFFSMTAGLFLIFMMASSIGVPPFLVNLGMEEYQLGYFYSITAAFSIVMSFSSRFFTNLKPKNVMSIIVLINIALYLFLLFIHPPFFILASAIFITKNGLLSLGSPILSTFIHNSIPEKIRATTMSTANMINEFFAIISSLLVGLCFDSFEPQKIFAFGGLFGFFAILCYQKIKN
jgi:MFS family permease